MKLVFHSLRAAIRLAKRLRYEKPHLSVERLLAEKRVKKGGNLAVEEARLPGGPD
jgi:hypothetical protein